MVDNCTDIYALGAFAGILNAIKSRRLDTFFEIEEKIMSKQTLDRSVLDIINDPECGLPEDKLRLFIIYYLCTNMSDADYNKHEAALSNIGCDLNPLLYLKRWRYKKTNRLNDDLLTVM